MARFYITTAIVYTNAPPHIGFALELVQADAIARWRRMMGDDVRFLTGTDEHGTKIFRAAAAAGQDPQAFVDGIAARVQDMAARLGVSNSDFIRTSDRTRHWPAAQKLWSVLAENGDLYKKSYEGNYCVGHEAFIRSNELVDGRCPLHKTPAERITEENWFFRLTKYKDRVRELIASDRLRIVPESRKSEILNLFDDAEDVSFSRPADQLSWGIPVPGDPSQTMYVWADALTNYLFYKDFWPADIHLIGKDILRFHAMLWPAMLLAAGLLPPKAVFVHGFITVEGEKMSKSLGNVVDPFQLLERYGADVSRYYLLRELRSTDDSDFSWKNLENRYESDLANGLGNLIRRVATLAETKLGGHVMVREAALAVEPGGMYRDVMDDSAYHRAFEQFRLHDACADIWRKIGLVNAYINERQPWKEDTETLLRTMTTVLVSISHIAWLLQPFMPATARRISDSLGLPLNDPLPDGHECSISKGEPLFPRR